MSKRFYELFLFDIYIAIVKIEEIIKRYKTPEELLHDFISWDSVIREFSIIAEATNQLIKLNIFTQADRKIVDFRNVLIHEYFGIDQDEVWHLANNQLTTLKKSIRNHISTINKTKKDMIVDELIEENSYLKFLVDELKKLKD